MAEAQEGGGLSAKRATVSSSEERRATMLRMRKELDRLRDEDDAGDQFYIDPNIVPDGWSYNFKRISVAGLEDVQHKARMRRMGWTPVPAVRHPELFGDIRDQDAPGIKGDQMLMERPVEFTRDAHMHDYKKARKHVADQSRKLQISSHDLLPRRLIKQKKTFASVDIPDDDA